MMDDLPRINAELRGMLIRLITCLSVTESFERRFDRALLSTARNHQQKPVSTPTLSDDILRSFWSDSEPPSATTPAIPSSDTPSPSPTPPPSPVSPTPMDLGSNEIGLMPAPRHILSKGARSALMRKRSAQQLGLELPDIVRFQFSKNMFVVDT